MSRAERARIPDGDDPAALGANVAHTARTVVTVVESFGEGLRRGGFEASLASYRQLADTVVNQRRWAFNHHDHRADAAFQRIAEEAGRIGGLLRSYVGVMDKLASLRVVPQASVESRDDPELPALERAVLVWLAARGHGASATQIRAATRLSSTELRGVLTRLELRGTIAKSGSTGRFLYSIAR